MSREDPTEDTLIAVLRATEETERLQAEARERFNADMEAAARPRAVAVQRAMGLYPRIPRREIAVAAGVNVSRLYQIASRELPKL